MEYKHPYFTEDEIEEDKKDILRLREKGVPYRRIAEELGRSNSYIKKIENILIEEGKTTKEKIELETEKYFKENPAAQGINKTKVHKKSDTRKADIRHQKSLNKKEQVYELVKKGYTTAEISHKLEMIDAVVRKFILELVEEGRIKEDEINKSKRSCQKIIDRTSKEYLETRNAIVELLKTGAKNFVIRKKLNLTPYETNIYISDIKRYKIMSSEQISQARELKKLQDLQFVAEHIKRGHTLKKIRELRPEFSYNEPTPLSRTLIELGIISKEKAEECMQKHINREIAKKHKKTIQKVRQYIEQGYYYYEIIDMMNISQTYLTKLKEEYSREYGWYSKDEIKKFQQERILREKIEQEEIKKVELERKRKEEIEKQRQNEIMEKQLKKVTDKVNKARSKAKKEDKKEENGETGVSTESRKKYLEILVEADSLGYKVTKEDINLSFNSIVLYPEMANIKNLKVVIMNTIRLEGIYETKRLINGLIRDLVQTPYINSLRKYKSWIMRVENLPKINKLKEQGLNSEQIAKELQISTYEVKQILEGTVPDFEDDMTK